MINIKSLDISGLSFGIQCNFPHFCGEERTKEAMETFRELVRLSKIGEATENALNILNSRIVVDEPNWTLVIATSTEELLEWNKNRNAKV